MSGYKDWELEEKKIKALEKIAEAIEHLAKAVEKD